MANVKAEKIPAWISEGDADKILYNDQFRKILEFFVFFSPSSVHCMRKRNFKYYGWGENPWQTNGYLKKRLDQGVLTSNAQFEEASAANEMGEKLSKLSLDDASFCINFETERAVFVKRGCFYKSLFHHIRCSLAHGRAMLYTSNGKVYYAMENIDKNNNINSRMILAQDSLLHWIDVIQNSDNYQMPDYTAAALEIIRREGKIRLKKIAAELNETDVAIKQALTVLINRKEIIKNSRGEYCSIP